MSFFRRFIERFKEDKGVTEGNNLVFYDDFLDVNVVLKEMNDEIQAMQIGNIFKKTKIEPYSVGKRIFYGGGEAMPIDEYQYLSQKVALKRFTEVSLKQREKVLKTKLEERYGFTEFSSDDYLKDIDARIVSPRPSKSKRIALEDIEKIASSINFTENLSTLLEGVKLDYRDYRDIVEEYESFVREHEAIKQMSGFLSSLSRQICFLLNLIKKRLRNLRQSFTIQHSFHFKNLEDYHDASFNLSF